MTQAAAENALIVADIGGTNGRFAIAAPGNAPGQYDLSHLKTYDNDEVDDFASLLGRYLSDLGSLAPSRASLATAGPNDGRRGLLTNRGWTLDAARLEAEFGLEQVLFVNDFTALACRIPSLPPGDFLPLTGATPRETLPVCVMGPGTGLGVALVAGTVAQPVTIATEGGHAAFAPGDALELRLLEYLRQGHEFVDTELILSGAGLSRLHRFLCVEDGVEPTDRTPAQVSAAALQGSDDRCLRAAQLFLSVLGGVAGDLALSHGAIGGVYIGGGVVPRLRPLLASSDIGERFHAKGRLRDYLSAIPLRLVTADNLALAGAAQLFDAHAG